MVRQFFTMKSKMSKAQQLAAKKHARHKQWKDDADKSLAEYVLSARNDHKKILRGNMGRGLHKWAKHILANVRDEPTAPRASTHH